MRSTALVTPRLQPSHTCHHAHAHTFARTCVNDPCLNGGRCVRFNTGFRCVCPGGTKGPRCKVLARTFTGDGWLWLDPLPPCSPTFLSLRLLTSSPDALLLHSGPLDTHHLTPLSPSPQLTLQLTEGQPHLEVKGSSGSASLKLKAALHDGVWHSLYLHLAEEHVAMMLDQCGDGWANDTADDTHCLVQKTLERPVVGREAWAGGWPLQVGGLAVWKDNTTTTRLALTPQSLVGCLSHLTVNGQVMDLGQPPHHHHTTSSCYLQQAACHKNCGPHGHCVGGLHQPACQCSPGWTGTTCLTPTLPATLGPVSYVKLSLSFMPPPHKVTFSVQVKASGAPTGLVLGFADFLHPSSPALTLHLRAGVACVALAGDRQRPSHGSQLESVWEVCVGGRPLGDNAWHLVTGGWIGRSLFVKVDDGIDEDTRNESVTLHPRVMPLLRIASLENVVVGGLSGSSSVEGQAVQHDLHHVCLDDLRICGQSLPLPPTTQATQWGQVTAFQGLTMGCHLPNLCLNTTCPPHLTCTPVWGHPTCSCGPGMEPTGQGCQDINECVWSPCLNGGTCMNQPASYVCLCGVGHYGENCQWSKVVTVESVSLVTLVASTAAATVFILVMFGIIGALLMNRRHCLAQTTEEEEDVTPTRILANPHWIRRHRRRRREGMGGERAQVEESNFWWRKRRKVKDPPPNILLSLQSTPPPPPPPPSFTPPAPPLPPQQQPFPPPSESEMEVMSPANPADSWKEKGDRILGKTLRPGILEAIDLLRHLPGKAREQPEDTRTKGAQGTTCSAWEDCNHQQAASASALEGVI